MKNPATGERCNRFVSPCREGVARFGNVTSMTFALFRWAADRIGIVPRLMLSSLLGVVLTVALVQAWTLRMVEDDMMEDAQSQLDASLRLLRQRLAPFGTEWALGPKGLTLGGTLLAGRNDIPDEVKA